MPALRTEWGGIGLAPLAWAALVGLSSCSIITSVDRTKIGDREPPAAGDAGSETTNDAGAPAAADASAAGPVGDDSAPAPDGGARRAGGKAPDAGGSGELLPLPELILDAGAGPDAGLGGAGATDAQAPR